MNHFQLFIQQTSEIIAKQWPHFWVKIPICFLLATAAFFFGLQNGSALLGLVVLVIFDMMMGVAASYTCGEMIQSRKMFKTPTKLAVYGMLCSAAFLVEKIVPGTTFLDEAMISFLALTELVSVMESAGKMGFSVPQKMLNGLKDKLKSS